VRDIDTDRIEQPNDRQRRTQLIAILPQGTTTSGSAHLFLGATNIFDQVLGRIATARGLSNHSVVATGVQQVALSAHSGAAIEFKKCSLESPDRFQQVKELGCRSDNGLGELAGGQIVELRPKFKRCKQ